MTGRLRLLLPAALAAGLLAAPAVSAQGAVAAPKPAAPAVESSAPAVPNERVRAQIEERRRWQRMVVDSPEATASQKAAAWGELGNLYHAYELLDEALKAYAKARELAPRDFRWPYYLGEAHRARNEPAEAIASYGLAVELAPRDVPSQVRLGETLFDQQRMAEAKSRLEAALALDPKCAACHFTLGLIANAGERPDRAAAASHFEAVLALQPDAAAVHTPLGLAYRNLGRMDDARAELAKVSKGDVTLADPLMLKVYGLADGLVKAMVRGDTAMQAGRTAEAVEAYKAAVVADPLYSLPRLRLGMAFRRSGDQTSAHEQLDIALRLAPEDAEANFNMAYQLLAENHPKEAIARYRTGLARRPEDIPARFNLARILLENGDPKGAVSEYAALTERSPEHALGWLGSATAQLALGHCPEAKASIVDGLVHIERDGLLSQALSRLLSSCPAESVRNGAQALDLAAQLYDARPSPEHAEAYAMALAELKRYPEAVEWAKKALRDAQASGRTAFTREIEANLALFQKGSPSRTPWPTASWLLLAGGA